jgi:hypothetical protein
VRDWQRLVQVSPFGKVGRDELASWHTTHSPKKVRIVHTLRNDRLDEILVSAHGLIMYLFSGYSPARGQYTFAPKAQMDFYG